jgi:AraC-like DNA-binding protein
MPASHGTTFSVIGLRPICMALAALGLDAPSVLQVAELDPRVLADPDARVPTMTAYALFREVVRVTGDDAIGIRAAQAIPLGGLEVLDVLARAAVSTGAALERFCAYYTMIHDGTELHLVVDGERALIVHDNPRSTEPPLAAIEMLFALVVVRGRQLSGVPLPVQAVRFRNPAPDHRAPHDRFFGCPVTFEWPRNELALDAAWLASPISGADDAVSAVAERLLRTITSQLATGDIIDLARRAVAQAMTGQEITLAAIARRLSMSTRTLQRRLREAGQSFNTLVDNVRREVAIAQLAERRLSIADVGYLVGFSEPSAFHRAFRRWTGIPPSTYRRGGR